MPHIVAAPRELDVKLLTEADMQRLTGPDGSTGLFDGEKLLKEATARGAAVTFWAR
jgi:hypothetical protein